MGALVRHSTSPLSLSLIANSYKPQFIIVSFFVLQRPEDAAATPNHNDVLLKLDMHCSGCVKKLKKFIRTINGTQTLPNLKILELNFSFFF